VLGGRFLNLCLSVSDFNCCLSKDKWKLLLLRFVKSHLLTARHCLAKHPFLWQLAWLKPIRFRRPSPARPVAIASVTGRPDTHNVGPVGG